MFFINLNIIILSSPKFTTHECILMISNIINPAHLKFEKYQKGNAKEI